MKSPYILSVCENESLIISEDEWTKISAEYIPFISSSFNYKTAELRYKMIKKHTPLREEQKILIFKPNFNDEG